MKKLLLLFAAGATFAAGAQTRNNTSREETIILKRELSDSSTVIELKDGKIFVNGEEMASAADPGFSKLHKKIIISNDGTSPTERKLNSFQLPEGFMNGEMPAGDHAMLGVFTATDDNVAGAKVDRISPGSPAEKAGLKPGDRITAIDDDKVSGAKDLVAAIGLHSIGDSVKVAYNRAGKPHIAMAMLTDNNGNAKNADGGAGMGGGMAGFSFEELSKSFNNMFGASSAPKLGITAEETSEGKGVRILEVKPHSAAELNGLMKNDFITKIGDDPIASVDDIQAALRNLKPMQKTKIQLNRAGTTITRDFSFPKETKQKDL